jgi:putative flippase GtrA
MAVRQALRFAVVGSAATAVHYVIALGLVSAIGWSPRWANLGGFLVAFAVSFVGQWKWTFSAAKAPAQRALPAYFLVAISSFLLNAALFELLLRYTPLPYYVSLAMVLGAVAVLTFVVSRRWAFSGSRT